jgi:hypothetical protein
MSLGSFGSAINCNCLMSQTMGQCACADKGLPQLTNDCREINGFNKTSQIDALAMNPAKAAKVSSFDDDTTYLLIYTLINDSTAKNSVILQQIKAIMDL